MTTPITFSSTQSLQLSRWPAEWARNTLASCPGLLALLPVIAKAKLSTIILEVTLDRITHSTMSHTIPSPTNAELRPKLQLGGAALGDLGDSARAVQTVLIVVILEGSVHGEGVGLADILVCELDVGVRALVELHSPDDLG